MIKNTGCSLLIQVCLIVEILYLYIIPNPLPLNFFIFDSDRIFFQIYKYIDTVNLIT